MKPSEMREGVPYIVTKGSSWAELRKGDRVEWAAMPGVLWESEGFRTLKVTRKAVSYRHFAASMGSWEVEPDRAGIMEEVAQLRRRAAELEKLLEVHG